MLGQELADKARGVISKQLIASVGAAAVFFLYKGGWAALSALYGGLVCIAATTLLLWGVSRASQAAASDPRRSMTILYVGAVQRFLLVLGLLAIGMAAFELDALAVLVGFAVAQISTMLVSKSKPEARSQ